MPNSLTKVVRDFFRLNRYLIPVGHAHSSEDVRKRWGFVLEEEKENKQREHIDNNIKPVHNVPERALVEEFHHHDLIFIFKKKKSIYMPKIKFMTIH